jgi:hypothetical protein
MPTYDLENKFKLRHMTEKNFMWSIIRLIHQKCGESGITGRKSVCFRDVFKSTLTSIQLFTNLIVCIPARNMIFMRWWILRSFFLLCPEDGDRRFHRQVDIFPSNRLPPCHISKDPNSNLVSCPKFIFYKSLDSSSKEEHNVW